MGTTNKQTSLSWFHFDTDISVATGTDTVEQTGQQRIPKGNDQKYVREHAESCPNTQATTFLLFLSIFTIYVCLHHTVPLS